MLPYISFPNQPFSDFCLRYLDQDTTFDIKLHNRKLCFHGQSCYSYNGVRHLPKPLPVSDNYLNQILLHLKSVLPNFQYDSDNEPEIMLNSDIVTISFGQARIAKFRSISASGDCPEQEQTLHHGDVVMMSRNSQDFSSMQYFLTVHVNHVLV